MNVTAEEFKKNPQRVYRAADKGGVVKINHGHYHDRIFELVARDRLPLGDKKDAE